MEKNLFIKSSEIMNLKWHMIPKTIENQWLLLVLPSGFFVVSGENNPSSSEAKNEGDDETSAEIQGTLPAHPREWLLQREF